MHLDLIWELQEVPAKLKSWMLSEAEKVASILNNPPSYVRNITEYAKRPECWESGISGQVGNPPDEVLKDFGISITDFNSIHESGKKEEKRNKDLDIELRFAKLVPTASSIRDAIESKGIASPKNMSAITKLLAGNINLNRGERNALKTALDRLEIDY